MNRFDCQWPNDPFPFEIFLPLSSSFVFTMMLASSLLEETVVKPFTGWGEREGEVYAVALQLWSWSVIVIIIKRETFTGCHIHTRAYQ